jgi:hypothetical protein
VRELPESGMLSGNSPVPAAETTAGGRRVLRAVLERVDRQYRRHFELRPVGPLLYLGLEQHRGAACPLYDGTLLEPGGWIGRLHFNNSQAASLQASSRLQAGVRFARLLRDSLGELAEHARADARLREIAVFEGITWLRTHGAAVGFDAQPLPVGLRRWLLGLHFRLLIWTFAPAARDAAMADVVPSRFRITRQALLHHFGGDRTPRRRLAGHL